MRFLKDNPALAVGIGLPILVVFFFSMATVLPRWLVAPPQYDFLFTAEFSNYASNNTTDDELKINVVENHVKTYRKKREKPETRNETHLFLFTAQNQGVREISIPTSSEPASVEWQEIMIPEIQSWQLDTNMKAPDGYEFHNGHGTYHSGIWPFFDSGGHRFELSVGKNGRAVSIMTPYSNINMYGTQTRFLGWVMAKGNP